MPAIRDYKNGKASISDSRQQVTTIKKPTVAPVRETEKPTTTVTTLRPSAASPAVSPAVKELVKEPTPVTRVVTPPAATQAASIFPKRTILETEKTIEEPTEPTKEKEKMAWKPKTIAGKILKGVVIGGAVTAAAATGVGAIAGVIGGTGAIAGAVGGLATAGKIVGKVVTGTGKGLGKVGQAAVNLVSGTTKEERLQIRDVKSEAKAAQDKLDQFDRLTKAGASMETAMKMVGLTYADLGAPESDIRDAELAQKEVSPETSASLAAKTGITPEVTKAGCAVTLLWLIPALGSSIAGLIIGLFVLFGIIF